MQNGHFKLNFFTLSNSETVLRNCFENKIMDLTN